MIVGGWLLLVHANEHKLIIVDSCVYMCVFYISVACFNSCSDFDPIYDHLGRWTLSFRFHDFIIYHFFLSSLLLSKLGNVRCDDF